MRSLLGVEPPLVDGGTGERVDVSHGSEVVRMEVREEDRDHRRVEAGELVRPSLARVGQPQTGVDEHVAAVDGKEIAVNVPRPRRQRHRHAPQASGEHVHHTTLATLSYLHD